jgi:hypothetical protein
VGTRPNTAAEQRSRSLGRMWQNKHRRGNQPRGKKKRHARIAPFKREES